jgi:hypothetical protein
MVTGGQVTAVRIAGIRAESTGPSRNGRCYEGRKWRYSR